MRGPTHLCKDVFILDRSQLPRCRACVVTQPRKGPSPSFTGVLPFCPQRHHQPHPELIPTSQTGLHMATAPCSTSTCLGPTAGTCRLGAQWSLYIYCTVPLSPCSGRYQASSSPPPPPLAGVSRDVTPRDKYSSSAQLLNRQQHPHRGENQS